MPSAVESAAEPIDLAIEHHQAGRLHEAEQGYRTILRHNPRERDALHLLGVVAHQSGRQEEAIRLIQQAIKLAPAQSKFHNSLGAVYQSLGHTVAAEACYRQSVTLDAAYPEGHHNLGMTLLDLGRPAESLHALERAVALKPEYASAHLNLGMALKSLGRLSDATAAFRRAASLRDGFWEALFQLGNVLKDQGRIDEALAAYQQVLDYEPRAFTTWSNMLCTLQYRDGISLAELAAMHARFDQVFGEPLRERLRPHTNDRDPDRTLRLGFISADLHSHPVGFFIVRMLEHLDRSRVEAVCYHNSTTADDITDRIRSAAAAWRDVRDWSDERLEQGVRDDTIDILFDLSGHTRDNRLLVFARRPAPIQITWAGYVGTTGLRTIDYVLADDHQIPAAAEAHHVERILRMPDGYVTYDPPAAAPAVSPLPALETGGVTFGSFNNQTKLGPRTVETWSRILHGVPGSRLLLKYYAMSNPAVSGRLREMFAGHGIAANRLVFVGSSSHAQQLAQYGEIDVALDPFPYSGGLTTLEALWMGVPVVTCPGETFAGRHALSHLTTIGLTETIAEDLDAYVAVAASLATDLPRLARLRAGLRDRVAASPLCDGRRFAREFARAMRRVWHDWIGHAGEAATRGAP